MIFASWGLGHITTFTFTSRCPREIRVQAIVAAVGGIESVFEAQKPHYVMGGTPGKVRLTGTMHMIQTELQHR